MSSIAIRRAQPANVVQASVATAQVFSLASNPQLPCVIPVPGALAIEAKRFTVRAEGNIQVAGAFTTKATLLAALTIPAAPFTSTNWTVLGSGTARALAVAGWAPWWIEANCIFDSQSGLLNGTFNQMVNNLFDAGVALAAPLTGINGSLLPVTQGGTVVPPTNPAFYFAVALTFGTAGANTGSIYNFELGF
jgi:hypothetical protein